LAVTQRVLGAIVIVFIAFGGAVLSLLYFKVIGLIIARRGDQDKVKFEHTSPYYNVTLNILLVFVIAGVIGFPFLISNYFIPVASQAMGEDIVMTTTGLTMHIGQMSLPIIPLIIAFLLLPVTIVLALFVRFKNVDRVKEYTCGEKVDYSFSTMYFSTDKATPYFTAVGILFFIALIAVVIL